MPITNRIRKSTDVVHAGAHSAGIWIDPTSGILKYNPDGSVRSVSPDASKGISIFLDPANGDDGNTGYGPTDAVATLAVAFALAVAGRGDTIYLLSDGTTAATARLSANFAWSKNNTNLVGVSAGGNISNRSRIAPTSGATSFANFFTVTGNGCRFENIQFFHGFTAGGAAAIALTLTNCTQNVFVNCHIAGMGSTDGADAQDTGSRNLLITGGGEHQFLGCTIGVDTIARTVANASVEFAKGTSAGGTVRNVFKGCRFLFFATGAGVLGVKVGSSGQADRWQEFDNCEFINSVKSGAGTAMTGVALLAASIGGLIFFRNCDNVGCGPWGSSDATTKAQVYVSGPITTNTTGIALTAVN